ncbi:hypothetical protein JB92DRAFT_2758552, partial [Gautieria morchelliformis]
HTGVHRDISCDGCQVPSIPGVRWKCLVCKSHDRCDKCHSAGIYMHPHKPEHPEVTIQAPQNPDIVLHDVPCRGCKEDQIRGTRWKCLQCKDYDLCDSCHSSKVHPPEHEMLKLEHPEQAESVFDEDEVHSHWHI